MSVPSNKGLVLLALVVAAVAASLVALSMGLLPASWVRGSHSLHTSHEVLAADTPPDSPQSSTQVSPRAAVLPTSCLPSARPPNATAALQQMLFRARQQAEQQHAADALAEFRSIGAIDPALPGLNLNISMALMQLKRTEEARSAIDAQLAMSDCLTQLSPADLAAYCHSEMALQTIDNCRLQTQDVRRTAHMQAALVEMELGRSLPATSPNAVAQTAPAPARDQPVSPAGQRKHPVDDSLAHGTGTDAALGAYSK